MSGEPILILETDPTAERQLNDVLTGAGYQVYAADSVGSVLQGLDSTAFPIVFIDAICAEPDLATVAAKAVERQPGCMVLFTGEECSTQDALDILRGGGADFISRPFAPEVVLERVADALLRRRRRRARSKLWERRAKAAEHALGQAEIGSGAHASTLELMDSFAEFALETFVGLERKNMELERQLRRHEAPTETKEREPLQAWVAHSDLEFAGGVVSLGPKLGLRFSATMSTGGEVLDKISDTPPQVLVLDAALPDIPGELLVQTVRAEWPELQMVVIEGWGSDAREVSVVGGSAPEVRRSMETVQDLIDMVEIAADRAHEAATGRDFAEAFKQQHEEFLRRFAELKKSLGSR